MKNWKKHLEILSFYARAPYMTIIWCLVPEQPKKSKFWKTEKNVRRYNHFTHVVYYKWQSWNMERDRQNFLSFWTIFWPFTPPNNPKNQNFEKMKKMPGDIIILHKCTKNHNHMLHCSWDTMRDGCNSYFLFWAIFCPFTPLTIQKIKIFKKWKKSLEISSFYIYVPKIMITWCIVPEIWSATDEQMDGKSDI